MDTVAADSSSLGIVIILRGAARDLPIRKAHEILPAESTSRRYATAP